MNKTTGLGLSEDLIVSVVELCTTVLFLIIYIYVSFNATCSGKPAWPLKGFKPVQESYGYFVIYLDIFGQSFKFKEGKVGPKKIKATVHHGKFGQLASSSDTNHGWRLEHAWHCFEANTFGFGLEPLRPLSIGFHGNEQSMPCNHKNMNVACVYHRY